MTGVPRRDARGTVSATGVLRGGLLFAFSRILPQVFTLIVSIVAARCLGSTLMGRQSYIAFVVAASVVAFTGGLPVALMRFVSAAAALGDLARLRRLILGSFIAASLLGAAAFVLIVALSRGQQLRGSWLLAAGTVSVLILHAVPAYTLRGLQRWGTSTLPGLVTGGVSVIAVVWLLISGFGVGAIFATELVAAAVNLIAILCLLQASLRRLGPASSAAENQPRSMAGPSIWRFTAVQWLTVLVTFVVTSRTEFFVLVRYANGASLAYYSIGMAAAQALFVMVEAAATALTPAVAALSAMNSHQSVSSGLARSLRLGFYGCIPLAAAAIAMGPALISVVYGPEYRPAGSVLVVSVVVLPLVATSYISVAALNALGRLRAQLSWNAIAAVADVLMAFWLIPSHGAVGAAITNAAARLVVAVPLLILAVQLMPRRNGLWLLVARVTLVSVAAGISARIALFALSPSWTALPASVLAFLGGYWVASHVVGPLSQDDAVWLVARVGPRLGGPMRRVVAGMARPQRL